MVNTDAATTPASTHGAHGPSDGLCSSVSKSASLATKPRNGGSAAMLAVAPAAITNSPGSRCPSQASRRMSRVPVAWSTMPTTMNRAALNIACAHSMVSPASIRSPPPEPTSTVMRPSWLTVPNARMSLRSYSRTARQPASSMVSRPSPTMIGRQGGASAKPGVSRATRYTPALTIAAACRYALTGVGAAIAPGSQKCIGTIADLDSAPMSTSTSATLIAVPPIPCWVARATSSESRYVPP